MATIMDGRSLSAEIRAIVKDEVRRFEDKRTRPCLATVLVGSDQASKLYISLKHRACQEVGIRSMDYQLPESSRAESVIELINDLNRDDRVHGILVQLPLPKTMEVIRIVERISPEKDVDGLHPIDMGLTMYKSYRLLPCTAAAVMAMLLQYSVEIQGRHAVIVSRSTEVGKPLAILLLNQDATVTVCHSRTRNIEHYTSDADILVSGVGRRPDFLIGEQMVKPGAAVVDIGMNRVRGKVCGDVDFEKVLPKASYITPVPGGIGPVTVAMLLRNTLIAAASQTRMTLSQALKILDGKIP